jgi:hypothetical protein
MWLIAVFISLVLFFGGAVSAAPHVLDVGWFGLLGSVAWGIISILRAGRRRRAAQEEAERQQQIADYRLFAAYPIVNSHRIRCPVCGSWGTLAINDLGEEYRRCDTCSWTEFRLQLAAREVREHGASQDR